MASLRPLEMPMVHCFVHVPEGKWELRIGKKDFKLVMWPIIGDEHYAEGVITDGVPVFKTWFLGSCELPLEAIRTAIVVLQSVEARNDGGKNV